jgi:hypothetical protein
MSGLHSNGSSNWQLYRFAVNAGVEPPAEDDLAVIATAVLAGALPVFVTVH